MGALVFGAGLSGPDALGELLGSVALLEAAEFECVFAGVLVAGSRTAEEGDVDAGGVELGEGDQSGGEPVPESLDAFNNQRVAGAQRMDGFTERRSVLDEDAAACGLPDDSVARAREGIELALVDARVVGDAHESDAWDTSILRGERGGSRLLRLLRCRRSKGFWTLYL